MYYEYGAYFPACTGLPLEDGHLHLRARNIAPVSHTDTPADPLSPAQLQPGTCYDVTCGR